MKNKSYGSYYDAYTTSVENSECILYQVSYDVQSNDTKYEGDIDITNDKI